MARWREWRPVEEYREGHQLLSLEKGGRDPDVVLASNPDACFPSSSRRTARTRDYSVVFLLVLS